MQMPQAVGETNLVACWLAKKKKKKAARLLAVGARM